MYLALAGRSECLTCVAALRQYGISFEEAYDRADELEVLYSKRSASLLNKQPPDFLAPSGNVGVSGSSGSGGGSGSSSAPPPLPTPSTFAFTAANTMTAGGGSGSGGSSSGMTSGPNVSRNPQRLVSSSFPTHTHHTIADGPRCTRPSNPCHTHTVQTSHNPEFHPICTAWRINPA